MGTRKCNITFNIFSLLVLQNKRSCRKEASHVVERYAKNDEKSKVLKT